MAFKRIDLAVAVAFDPLDLHKSIVARAASIEKCHAMAAAQRQLGEVQSNKARATQNENFERFTT